MSDQNRTILVTGATFSGLEWTNPVIAAFAASVIGSIAMWWLYFDTASDFGTRVISSSENPGHLGRLAYTYLHIILVAGIILTAVADEFVLAHPSGHSSGKLTIAVLGSSALYLMGSLLFKRAISGKTPLSHFTAIVILAPLVAPRGVLVLNRHERPDARRAAAALRPLFRKVQVQLVRRSAETALVLCRAPRLARA